MKLTKLLRHFSHFLSSLFIIMATITTTIIAITTTTTSSSRSGIIFADAFCYTPLVTSSLSSSKRKTQHAPNINIQTPPLLLQSMNYNNENMNHELQDQQQQDQQQQDQEVENKKEKEKKEIPEDHYSKNHPMAGWAGWKHPQWGGYLDNIHKNVPENMSGGNEDE